MRDSHLVSLLGEVAMLPRDCHPLDARHGQHTMEDVGAVGRRKQRAKNSNHEK
jgi:hypothetical protein